MCPLSLLALWALAAACAAPLADSPYQRIAKADPRRGEFRLRVEARLEETYSHVVLSPSQPGVAEVRAAFCEGLSGTRFACIDERDPRAVPDYVVRVSYDVIESPFYRARGLLGGVIMGGGVGTMGEDDPAQDAVHYLLWRFSVHRPGEQVPLFRAPSQRERIQMWPFTLRHWAKRYFSE